FLRTSLGGIECRFERLIDCLTATRVVGSKGLHVCPDLLSIRRVSDERRKGSPDLLVAPEIYPRRGVRFLVERFSSGARDHELAHSGNLSHDFFAQIQIAQGPPRLSRANAAGVLASARPRNQMLHGQPEA